MNLNNIVKNHHGYIIRGWNIELARYRYYLRDYDETIFDVVWADHECQKTGNNKKLRDELDYLDKFYYQDGLVNESDIPIWLSKQFDELKILSYLDEDHCGDCTKMPATCLRCYYEELIGCPTKVDNTKSNCGDILCDYQPIN